MCGVVALYLLLVTQAVASDGWAGFYRLKASEALTEDTMTPPMGMCLDAILDAQKRYNIPDNLLLAIGLQEAGRQVNGQLTIWPWTANSNGKGNFFGSKEALEAWVRQTQTAGTRSIDVGCMQVNQKWHGRHFASIKEAIDPVSNVDYAARFLISLHAETRDWWQAAGRYHSSTDTHKAIYLKKLTQNQRLANANAANFADAARDMATRAQKTSSRPQPSINWSSDMTGLNGRDGRAALSIYSSLTMQPILPDYAETK